MNASARHHFSKRYSSSHASVEVAIQESLAFLGAHDPQCDGFAVELVLREGLVNALKHGNRMRPEKTIDLSIEVCSSVLVISIEDEGDGFDWQRINLEAIPSPEQDHGRGLVLYPLYGFLPLWNEKGNRVTLTLQR